ncbi:hypothetical protein RB200_26165 [Streptomyces sp. PmtG]
MKATTRPSALSTGWVEGPFAAPPSTATLMSRVAPAAPAGAPGAGADPPAECGDGRGQRRGRE